MDNIPEGTLSREPKRASTVVCVTDQLRCDRIIRSGRVVANMTDTDLVVINVCTPARQNDPAAMEYLFRVAADYGGEMAVLYSDAVAKAIARYIKGHRVGYLVTGVPQPSDSVIMGIWRKFTHITYFIVEEGGELCEVTRTMMQNWDEQRA